MTHLRISVLILLLAAAQTFSQPSHEGIRVGQPVFGGNGCPEGSGSVSLAPDGSIVSIILDSFIVSASRASGRSTERKSCGLAIPVHVPEEYSISLGNAEYRGHANLPAGAQALVNTEYFFAGSRGPIFSRTFDGPKSEDITLTHNPGDAAVWSPCGQDVNLRVNLSLRVKTNPERDDAVVEIDQGILNQLLVVKHCDEVIP